MMGLQTDWNFPGYRIQQPVGHGGMGELLLAVQQSSGRKVVIKTASPTADDQTRSRLIKEHSLLRAIDHPNVAKVLDCGCLEDRPYLVLQYVEGTSLRTLMSNRQPMQWDRFAFIIEQLSGALTALHSQGILHRDVKPENVLIDDQGTVTLIDLSIGTEVANLGALTRSDEILGTVDYMAPEQRHGLQVDARTDEYSLAAMAFEMLTGCCPLGQFRKPSELNPKLPLAASEALLRGLERDPEERFPSVECFVHALLEAGREHRDRRKTRRALIEAAAVLATLTACIVMYMGPHGLASSDPDAVVASKTPVGGVTAENRHQVMTNSLGMQLVRIAAGSFQMGASRDELTEQFGIDVPGHFLCETPKHSVQLSQPFWMGACEVSVAQFRVFAEETGYRTTSERWMDRHGRSPTQPLWNDPIRYTLSDDLPVAAVSWEDAANFCKWLSDREGITYRLPTEAEWEYACRAGTTGPWSCAEGELGAVAVSERGWCDGPGPIGQLRANPWGLHDMHGNVWEWCQDRFSPSFYAISPISDPVCGESESQNVRYVLRGGAYKASPRAIRSTIRKGYENSESHADRGHAIGFRIVRDLSSTRIASRNE